MEILVTEINNDFEPYVIHNVVSINKILGHILIQYIDENNTPQTTHYDDKSFKIRLTAIVL